MIDRICVVRLPDVSSGLALKRLQCESVRCLVFFKYENLGRLNCLGLS